MHEEPKNMSGHAYTQRLVRKETVWWKRIFDVQAPYRWNLRRLSPGLTLEVGCGIGRNLLHLDDQGVGVDHNAHSVGEARRRGLIAYTPEEFKNSPYFLPAHFDSILLAHVAEHMSLTEAVECIRGYLVHLRPEGKLILITPQEVGYRSDPSHVEFMDFGKLWEILNRLGFSQQKSFSFPFPRIVGTLFIYNEFVVVGKYKSKR